MTFDEVLSQTLAMLQQRGRVSYRALKRQFGIDDGYLEDLKEAICFAHPQVVDKGGRGLVWTGDTAVPPLAMQDSAPQQDRALLTYTPAHLTEKIIASRAALEGERKQVTVLFADLKGSLELLADRDPEELGMRPLLAHCRLGLGALYLKIGRPEQAHAELSAAIELYRAMAMTFYLNQAEAALAQVTGSGSLE